MRLHYMRRMDDQIETGAKRLAYLFEIIAAVAVAYLVALALSGT